MFEIRRLFFRLSLYGMLLTKVIVLHSNSLEAACSSLVQGNVVIDVKECRSIKPELIFNSPDDKFKNIRDLDSRNKSKFYGSYRGLWLRGDVIQSSAIRSGLSEDKGVLKGESHPFFVNSSVMPGECQAIMGQRLEVNLVETCCDGGVESPCLLDTSFQFKSAKVLGEAKPGTGNSARSQTKTTPEYQKALIELQKKNYKAAAIILESLMMGGKLDIIGRYRLGVAYRNLDECKKAIAPLKYNYDEYLQKKSWADQQDIIQASNFLLARCYAKLNQPGNAVMILDEYLLEPSKFRKELSQSLKHKDFGYIHTSKEYKIYKKEAEKKLIN